ncbi:hypothetical protein WSM22_18930 [Cytophagales bacterium WSM2-2]|nr:hypothetical protein WSM22_18930 [Cytophagales bacterium WSM2-2]
MSKPSVAKTDETAKNIPALGSKNITIKDWKPNKRTTKRLRMAKTRSTTGVFMGIGFKGGKGLHYKWNASTPIRVTQF